MTIDLGFAWLDAAERRRRSASSTCRATSASSRTCWPASAASTWRCWSSPPTRASCRRPREHLAILDLLRRATRRRGAHQGRPGRDGVARAGAGGGRGARWPATGLAGAPMVPGLGDDRRRAWTSCSPTLDRAAGARRRQAATRGRPRLPVDRVFTIAGFGTVVTGTLVDGELRSARRSRSCPAAARARCAALQSAQAQGRRWRLPGSRVAVNLVGVVDRRGRSAATSSPRRAGCGRRAASTCGCGVVPDAPQAARAQRARHLPHGRGRDDGARRLAGPPGSSARARRLGARFGWTSRSPS